MTYLFARGVCCSVASDRVLFTIVDRKRRRRVAMAEKENSNCIAKTHIRLVSGHQARDVKVAVAYNFMMS